jgi:hypothetical protein
MTKTNENPTPPDTMAGAFEELRQALAELGTAILEALGIPRILDRLAAWLP